MASRAAYLAALGVPDWRQRRRLAVQPEPVAPPAAPAQEPPAVPVGEPAEVQVAVPAAPPAVQEVPASPLVRSGIVVEHAGDDWDRLAGQVASCTRCALHKTRHCTVFGVGDRQARWLIVGEAPGAEEDRCGEPFVGRAGKLLDAMLRAIGLAREQVYIANILKCRPPDNRNPLPAEVAQCLPYLERQIALIRPAIMLAVGSVAAQNLLGTDAPVGRLRGRVHAFGAARTPLVVTYHPAYLLRSPGEKRRAWEDLKFARRIAGASVA